MGYHTVFDVTRVGFQWWIPLLMFIFAGMIFGIGWAVRSSGERDSDMKGGLFQIVGVIGLLAAAGWFVSTYSEYHNAAKALATNQCSVAEGVISDFVPMPPGGHSTESFRVAGVKFAYGGGWGSTVFNSEWNTGFIRNGVQAKVTYRGSDILKIEVK
jgi:hypothetical protein